MDFSGKGKKQQREKLRRVLEDARLIEERAEPLPDVIEDVVIRAAQRIREIVTEMLIED